jgi:hypothetical protein
MELGALHHNKELAFQQYHKICGAIEILETMQKNVLEHEKSEAEKFKDAEGYETEPVLETAAVMD